MGIFFKLDSACCGCSVAGVTVFILYAGLICSTLKFFSNLQETEVTPAYRQQIFDKWRDLYKNSNDPDLQAENMTKKTLVWMEQFRKAVLSDSVMHIILCGLALFGFHQKRPAFFLAYLVWDGLVLIIIALFLAIILICVVAIHPVFLMIFIPFFIFAGIYYYLFLIVYNHYRNLKEEVERRGGSIKYNI